MLTMSKCSRDAEAETISCTLDTLHVLMAGIISSIMAVWGGLINRDRMTKRNVVFQGFKLTVMMKDFNPFFLESLTDPFNYLTT